MGIISIVQATILLGLIGFSAHTFAEDDSACLEAFKKSVKDPNNFLYNWDFTNKSICSFAGVVCWTTQENKVLNLKIEQAGLSGDFPSGLDKCGSLTSLSLAGNAFFGSIPSDICKQVKFVTTLDLSDNSFSGAIPDDLANCLYLNNLYLQKNKLNGSIPGSIGVLSRLSHLDVSSNYLSGRIPSSFTNRSLIYQQAFPASAFQGNAGLCGPPLNNTCGSQSQFKSKAFYGGFAVGVAVILLLLAPFIMCWRRIRSLIKGSV